MQNILTRQDRGQCFIEKARGVHGDKYSYDGVVYKGNKTKVAISCKKHGEFLQVPSSHLRGCGCKGCAIERRSIARRQSLGEFIAKAQHKHEGKYSYDQIKNYSASSKVSIVCPEHGAFMMEPSNHLSGQGCKACGVIRRSNKCRSSAEEFIAQAHCIYGDRYSYGEVDYINARTNVIIGCAKHGSFEQTPDTHLVGHGCRFCAAEQRGECRKFGMGVHIERARKRHNNFYDYALVPLEGGARDKVQIGCPSHGLFSQDFYEHSRGRGCPECFNERRNMTRKDKEVFVHEAKSKHGARYDYSKVDYINAYTKIKIICSVHGLFEMTPTKHLSRGDGCPECGFLKRKGIGGITEARLKKEPELGTVSAWVYIAYLEKGDEKFFKIGHTTNRYPESRFSFFNTYSWTIEHAVSKSLCEALILENELKSALPRYTPKLKFNGYTECILEDPWPLLKELLNP
ncbi:MAG: hypothetical protein WA173_15690 [Pseudomonas sp.]|uniref:hypothetical protein n=1 Tax=Pseudomonas sp. TaxID=306 RepID=UPI003BB4EBF2